MSSSQSRRELKTPKKGGYPPREVVNTPKRTGALELWPAQNAEQTNEEGGRLMEQVVERNNMVKALARVEQNRGAAGIDGMETRGLGPYLQEQWGTLKEQLLTGNYHPRPVRRVEIPKPEGGTRQLGIPTVIDRLIQQAMLQVMTPIYEPTFSEHSFGFRPGRNAHQAVRCAQGYIREGYIYVVDIDIEKFFDNVNHDILMNKIAQRVKDKRVLKLIGRYLRAGVMVEGCHVQTEVGTPQGGPLSPLLANILLDSLDKELERREHKYVRYADDCNIYLRSERAGERVLESISGYISQRLKLRINRGKSGVGKPSQRKILGFSFTGEKEPRIRLAAKAIKRIKAKVEEITSRSRAITMEERQDRLNKLIKGWIGYFRLIDTESVLQRLDEWIRHRLRMCLLKQWKRGHTKCQQLVKLGIAREWARRISGSRKGYWRLSNTPQMNKALGIAYWEGQGLISLVAQHRLYRHSLRTAVYRTVRTVV
jgi:RNA-directed DNA polymerase